MKKANLLGLALCLAAMQGAFAQSLKVTSDRTVGGFAWPESVGCDTAHKVLYVGNFGSEKLDPGLKDAKGYISKVSLDGKILEKHFLPAKGVTMNKPKGIWIRGERLWVTDIDGVWIFDTKTKKGRKLDLPGVVFANDPAVVGNALYVTDNRSDQLVKVEPADFLSAKVKPKITQVFKGDGVNPNGIYPGRRGAGIYLAGFVAPDKPRALYVLGGDGKPHALSEPIGRLDGLYVMNDGTVLSTDWNTGSLFHWSKASGMEKLATGFKGPADFCVASETKDKLSIAAADLVASHVRLIELSK